MKVYKFRSLASELDYYRIKELIETGEFFYSKFFDLNDPMEGSFMSADRTVIDGIYSKKNEYRICSFSGVKGFNNPAMWGYYANGFCGIVIEVEVEKNSVRKINYIDSIDIINSTNQTEKLLLSKFKNWKHENELRSLVRTESQKHKVGRISKIYFGNPYGRALNQSKIFKESHKLMGYKSHANKLIQFLKHKPEIKMSFVYTGEKQIVIENTTPKVFR